MSVTGYVDRSFHDVLRALAERDVEDLFNAAMAAAFGSTTERPFTFCAVEPQQIAAGSARVHVTWRFTDRSGAEHEHAARMLLFAVQSGSEPVTELALSFTVDDGRAGSVADVAHRFLDELTGRLAATDVDRLVPGGFVR